jgi:septal ring-binding cell division protein DamX
MARNKAQQAAAERAKKSAAPVAADEVQQQQVGKPNGKVVEATPTPAAKPATPAPVQPSKQQQAIETLRAGWLQNGVNLDKLTVRDDGKFKLLVVADGWPTVRLGPTGGITVMELHSYAKAYDAAMNGKELFEKQQARDAKKAVAAQPAAQPAAPAAEKAPAAKQTA